MFIQEKNAGHVRINDNTVLSKKLEIQFKVSSMYQNLVFQMSRASMGLT